MKIEDTLECIIDNRGKTPPVADNGHRLLEINCIATKGKFPNYNLVKKHVSDEIYDTWFRSGHPKKGDILIPTVGTLDAIAFMDRDDCCIAQNLIAFRTKQDVCNSEFLFYLLSDETVRKRLLNLNIGGVQPSIKVPHLKKLEVNIPPIDLQMRVVSILHLIDEQIKFNEQINENLEQQAQAYFDKLFVANADPNWPECTLSDVGSIVAGGTPSKSKVEYYTDHGIAWITPKDLSVDKSKFISHGENDISELGLTKSSATKMPVGTVLFSSRAPIGYIAIAQNEVTTNQGFKSVIPNENIGTAYVYFLLKNLLPTIEGMASGSTFKEISGAGMKSVPTVMPDTDTIQLFRSFCEPLFKEQEVLEAENKHLSALRDSLLPKLMSGEIDVSELDL